MRMKEQIISAEQEGFDAFRSGQRNFAQARWLARTKYPQFDLQEAFLAGWRRSQRRGQRRPQPRQINLMDAPVQP